MRSRSSSDLRDEADELGTLLVGQPSHEPRGILQGTLLSRDLYPP